MSQDIGFDILGDLYLKPNETFNWENKATSLYCIVTGNISSNFRTIVQVLTHLSTQYQAVFFVPGRLEYANTSNIVRRTEELAAIGKAIPNICMLHQHVATIDGIAVVGTNGWAISDDENNLSDFILDLVRKEDFEYLAHSVDKLQRHLDVKKIIVVSNEVPHPDLYFGEAPASSLAEPPLVEVLSNDTENKVSHWVFGTYKKPVDTNIGEINFVNNPYIKSVPYWAKRLTITI